MSKLLTTHQAATILHISPRRVVALIHAKKLPARKVGRDWIIKARDLARVSERKPGRPSRLDAFRKSF